MRYLLDTNVVSEGMKPFPDSAVANWILNVDEELLALSVVTIAEIRSGIVRLPAGKRRQALESWLDEGVRDRFRGRILGIDEAVAETCGRLLGQHHLTLHVRRIMDIWLAAIALTHGLTLVTRNVKDFQELGVRLVNPWNGNVHP